TPCSTPGGIASASGRPIGGARGSSSGGIVRIVRKGTVMRAKGLIGTLAVAIGVLAAPAMRASDFVGVYCLPDKVVLEPNDTEPQRAQIWGAFLMADTKTATGYLAAERGYLYYACPQGKDNACLNEWSDLKA